MEVDIKRRRIGLSMRLDDDSREQPKAIKKDTPGKQKPKVKRQPEVANSAMADALAQAFKR